MGLNCGSCNLCCRLLNVPDINKPARMLCWWTTVHGGCSRHAEKPDPTKVHFGEDGVVTCEPSEDGKDLALTACAQFQCLWLASQQHSDPSKQQSRMMRPDVTHVVMGPRDRDDDTLLYVQVDPEHRTAWQKPEIHSYLEGIVERGGKVEIIIGDSHFRPWEPLAA